MDLDFDMAFGKILEELESADYAVLATSADDMVSARTIAYAVRNSRIYFQTDRNFEKYRQILRNGCVAFVVGAVQIEGRAKILGRPSSGELLDIAGALRRRHPENLSNLYSTKSGEIEMIEVSPVFVKVWSIRDGMPAIEFLDVSNRTASREYYG